MYNSYKRKVTTAQSENSTKQSRLDTVGAVALSRNGVSASGVSSGGIALKVPGRIGQAAMFGAGCWAQENVALSTSGVGEYLTRTLLAREMGRDLLRDSDKLPCDVIKESFVTNFNGKFPTIKFFLIRKFIIF